MPPGTILNIENCPEDIELLKRMFKSLKVKNPLFSVGNGEDAFFYLMGSGPFADRDLFPFPNLVLLDVGLPGWDGFEVLAFIRAEETLRQLPVVMLSNSDAPEDKERAMRLGADAYITKTASRSRLYDAFNHVNAKVLTPTFPDAVIDMSPPAAELV